MGNIYILFIIPDEVLSGLEKQLCFCCSHYYWLVFYGYWSISGAVFASTFSCPRYTKGQMGVVHDNYRRFPFPCPYNRYDFWSKCIFIHLSPVY